MFLVLVVTGLQYFSLSSSRGAVSVSMDIRMLDIDQCPGKYHMPNAFKDTHKCDDKSSYVSAGD